MSNSNHTVPVDVALNIDNETLQKMPTSPSDPTTVVVVACRRQGCDGNHAKDVNLAGVGHRYTCVKCDHTWTVAVGGAFNF